MNCCGRMIQYSSKDLFGCLRKEDHEGEHLSYLEFGGFNSWERDWDCGCPDEEECQCAFYTKATDSEVTEIIFSDFGEDPTKFPESLKDAIEGIKKNEDLWR